MVRGSGCAVPMFLMFVALLSLLLGLSCKRGLASTEDLGVVISFDVSIESSWGSPVVRYIIQTDKGYVIVMRPFLDYDRRKLRDGERKNRIKIGQHIFENHYEDGCSGYWWD